MNDELLLLGTIAKLLAQGYLINDILILVDGIFKNDKSKMISERLECGKSLDEAIIEVGFNKTFIEYLKFFRLKNDLSKAINQSIKICQMKNDTIKRLKKELSYPLLLVVFLLFFSLFIVYGLLPSIMQLFTEFSINQSFISKIMFMFFRLVPIFTIVVILLLITLSFITIYAIKKQYFKLLDNIISHFSFLKRIIQKYFSLKFALYYNELLVNGYDSTDIIIMLYKQIEDSDIKMIIYEIYIKINQGEELEKIVSEFVYFEELFVVFFRLLLNDFNSDKSLLDYLNLSLEMIHLKVNKIIRFIVPIVYCFTASFVILVYISIIIPMMNVISDL